jgi:hypothetical protein
LVRWWSIPAAVGCAEALMPCVPSERARYSSPGTRLPTAQAGAVTSGMGRAGMTNSPRVGDGVLVNLPNEDELTTLGPLDSPHRVEQYLRDFMRDADSSPEALDPERDLYDATFALLASVIEWAHEGDPRPLLQFAYRGMLEAGRALSRAAGETGGLPAQRRKIRSTHLPRLMTDKPDTRTMAYYARLLMASNPDFARVFCNPDGTLIDIDPSEDPGPLTMAKTEDMFDFFENDERTRFLREAWERIARRAGTLDR